jgi:hypothetical protein
MSRKHVQALAAEIAQIHNAFSRTEAALAVARAARQFNPAFDKEKFLMACGC